MEWGYESGQVEFLSVGDFMAVVVAEASTLNEIGSEFIRQKGPVWDRKGESGEIDENPIEEGPTVLIKGMVELKDPPDARWALGLVAGIEFIKETLDRGDRFRLDDILGRPGRELSLDQFGEGRLKESGKEGEDFREDLSISMGHGSWPRPACDPGAGRGQLLGGCRERALTWYLKPTRTDLLIDMPFEPQISTAGMMIVLAKYSMVWL